MKFIMVLDRNLYHQQEKSTAFWVFLPITFIAFFLLFSFLLTFKKVLRYVFMWKCNSWVHRFNVWMSRDATLWHENWQVEYLSLYFVSKVLHWCKIHVSLISPYNRCHSLRVYLQVNKWLQNALNLLDWGWKDSNHGLGPISTKQTSCPYKFAR